MRLNICRNPELLFQNFDVHPNIKTGYQQLKVRETALYIFTRKKFVKTRCRSLKVLTRYCPPWRKTKNICREQRNYPMTETFTLLGYFAAQIGS
jgi:hypothetical protein